MPVNVTYQIRCTTDNTWESVTLTSDQPAPTTCPVDGGHAIDSGATYVSEVVITPDYLEVTADSSTMSTDFSEKASLVVEVPTDGDYKITWYYEHKSTHRRTRVQVRVQLDDTTDLSICDENADAQDLSGWGSCQGFATQTLTAGSHTLDVDFSSSKNGKAVHLRRVRLNAERIGD